MSASCLSNGSFKLKLLHHCSWRFDWSSLLLLPAVVFSNMQKLGYVYRFLCLKDDYCVCGAHPCMCVCIKVDTAAALESDNTTSSHLFHLSLSSLAPSPFLFYSLPGSCAEASAITAASTCLLTVSNGDRRLGRREGEDSGCMPATMGENCHTDRAGDREMKGSGKNKHRRGSR